MVDLQGQAHPLHGAEKIGQDRKFFTSNGFKKEGRSPGFTNPVGNFTDFQVRIEGFPDANQFPLGF